MWGVEAGAETVVTLAVVLAVVAAWDAVDLRWWLIPLVVVPGVAWAVTVPRWRYAVHRWEVTDTAVYTQVGWWARERRIAPMSRIQTVDHAEGPLERLFRLSSVTVTTASAAGALKIEGLDRDVARALVERLTHRADAVPGDAT